MTLHQLDGSYDVLKICSPDSVAGTAVTPPTLNLLEPINAVLLPPEAAAGSVDVVNPRFGVYCKV